MLILPPGHAREVAQRRGLSSSERWIVGGVAAVALIILLVTIVAITSSHPKLGRGCIDVTVPSSMGAQELSGCGDRARAMCAAVNVPGGYTGSLARAVSAECRRWRIPVG